MKSTPDFVIVIGASAGGSNATAELISHFQTDIHAAILIVIHLAGTGISELLALRLQNHTRYTCKVAEQGELIQANTAYIATANHHLLLKDSHIVLGSGPMENRWRPSIDILFRSAAASYSNRAIGIILTGMLDDGTAGMSAIKRSGGICVVQDPNEAEFPDMPLSVLDNMEVDYCAKLSDIGALLNDVIKNTASHISQAPPDVIAEAQIAERASTTIDDVKALGEHSVYVCPDCGGGLWHLQEDRLDRYRCHIGHSYTEKDLLHKQGETLENTLWAALRMMEERSNLLRKMSKEERSKGLNTLASFKEQRDTELQVHIMKLKEILFEGQRD